MPTGLTVRTPTLEIGYEAHGDASGFPVILLHGFPDDVRAWDAVAPPLWPPDIVCWSRICAGTGRRASWMPRRRAWRSRRRLPRICSIS